MLLVGESAPSGGTFFYRANSQAYRTISQTFGRRRDPDFLAWFKSQGYYLDDLVLAPIDKIGTSERRAARRAAINGLATRIAAYTPKIVVAIALSIEEEVAEAVRLSGTSALFRSVNFPGNGQQTEFHRKMAAILPLVGPA
jgi:hypothetical protein